MKKFILSLAFVALMAFSVSVGYAQTDVVVPVGMDMYAHSSNAP